MLKLKRSTAGAFVVPVRLFGRLAKQKYMKKKRLFKTLSYKKAAKKLFLKTFKKFLKRLKNTRRFNVLGRHHQVKKKQYEYSINKRKVVH